MKPKKILIVEDDQDMAKVLCKRFKKSGFDVMFSYNGQQALDLLAQERFDAVLLDLMLPQKDGFSVLQERVLTPNGAIPVCVLTAIEQEEKLDRARALGAKRCYVKSHVSLAEVVDSIRGDVGLRT